MTAQQLGQIATALGGTRKDGAGYVALCPCHDDQRPSLALHLADDGRLLWHCRAGCSQDDVRAELAGRGLLNGHARDPQPRQALRTSTAPAAAPDTVPDMHDAKLGKPAEVWTYYDADSHVLFHVARYETAEGKTIRPWTWDGSRWVQKAYPAPRPLYGLPRLGRLPDAPVLVVEGEKCADAVHVAIGADTVCMTWAGGAAAVAKSDWTPLQGVRVLVWPDRDDPGRRAAEEVRSILPHAEVLDVPGDDGWDCADLLATEGAEAVRRFVAECPRMPAAQDDASTHSRRESWPADLPDEAFHGLAGEIARAIGPHTESDPAAVLLQVLVSFGALVGRGPHVRVEGDQHHSNLFALLVGDTSKARKGTSWGRVREIFGRIASAPNLITGLSTGEGLKYAVRDEIVKYVKGVEEIVDPGVTDKRLLVMEPEFAQVLRQGARGGNTLSATIRCAWDTGSLRTLTRADPVTATGAHICIIGHITQDELRAELTQTDSANGFANRFIFMSVKRSKVLPFGGAGLAEEALSWFAERLLRAAEMAKAVTAISMSNSARELWIDVYPALSEGHPGLLGAVTARAEAQCLRLALIYALLDEATQIGLLHLQAALAVWKRSEESARFIFGSALGDPVADEIYRALRVAVKSGLTRTDISNLFRRNQPAERIDVALQLLLDRGMVVRSKSATGPGRPTERWMVAT